MFAQIYYLTVETLSITVQNKQGLEVMGIASVKDRAVIPSS